MWSNNGMSNTEIREYCYQLVKDSEKDGVSPQEAVAIKRRAHVMLSALGDEMPFLSCKDEFIEFNLLQENNAEKLLAIEKDLDRKSTRLNSSHPSRTRMQSSAWKKKQ